MKKCDKCGSVLELELERALTIPDLRWPTEAELAWLASRASERKIIVEVGCYVGRTTRALKDNTEGLVIVVDDFYGPRDIEIPEEERKDIYFKFLQNTGGGVETIRADHAEHVFINKCLAPLTPDMIFIDGAHDYDSVVRDITYWRSKLAPGGLLCGHDWDWQTVKDAVVDTLGIDNVGTVPGTNLWLLL